MTTQHQAQPQQYDQYHPRPPPVPLEELPLRPSTLLLLQQRGFVHLAEMEDSKQMGGMTTLAAELNVDLEQASKIYREVMSTISIACSESSTRNNNGSMEDHGSRGLVFGGTLSSSLSSLLSPMSHQHQHIVSFSRSIDELLGGGIPLGSVTEISGLPGTGKTQLAMQLAVNARLPAPLGGVHGQTLYIDAEGSFSPERTCQMAHALVSHVNRHRSRQLQLQQQPPQNSDDDDFTAPIILNDIQVLRVHDEASQTATLYNLPHWIQEAQQQHPLTALNNENNNPTSLPIKLVVIDSIAFHYRAMAPNQSHYYLQRTKALTRLASFLGALAIEHNIAIVVLNQMTTKFVDSTSSDSSSTATRSVPALGESWAHATTTRLLLSQAYQPSSSEAAISANSQHQRRSCRLIKSPHKPSGVADFQILSVGIRDCPSNENKNKSHYQHENTSNNSVQSHQPTPSRDTENQDPTFHHNQANATITPSSLGDPSKRLRTH